jgi:hypothetical protein
MLSKQGLEKWGLVGCPNATTAPPTGTGKPNGEAAGNADLKRGILDYNSEKFQLGTT